MAAWHTPTQTDTRNHHAQPPATLQPRQAKNFVPGKEAQSTKVAAAVIELQRRLPKARVLYCSATGVSEVRPARRAPAPRVLPPRTHPEGSAPLAAIATQRPSAPGTARLERDGLSLDHARPHLPRPPCQVGNMAYMTRMHLWGPGTAFPDFEGFLDSMKKR